MPRTPVRRTDPIPDLDAAIRSLIRSVGTVERRLDRVAQAIDVLDRESQAARAILFRHLSTLTTLLLDRGVLDPDDLQAANDLAGCEAIWATTLTPPPSLLRRRRRRTS